VLDGSNSYDIDNTDPLTYNWSGPEGIEISDPSSAIINFTAPNEAGELVFELEVNDGQESSSVWSGLDLFISEIGTYNPGSTDRAYVEIYNGTGADIDLSDYELWVMKLNDGEYEGGVTNWPSRKFVFDPLYDASNDPTFNANMEFHGPNYLKNKNIMQMQDEKDHFVSWYHQCKYIVEDEDCNDDGIDDDSCDRLILPNDANLLILKDDAPDNLSDGLDSTYIKWNRSFGGEGHPKRQSNQGLDAFSGGDAFGLAKNSVLIDVIGNNGGNKDSWPVAGIENATDSKVLVRKPTIVKGNTAFWDAPDGAACSLPDYSYCNTGSAGSNANNSEWIVYDANYTVNSGVHLCTSCDNQVVVNVKNNFAPCDVAISSTDEYGNVMATSKGAKLFLTLTTT
jgi:hypothetical protein